MGRLYAAESLNDAPLPDQLVHVAANGHLRDGQQSCQVLIDTGPDRIKVLDNRVLAFGGVHRLTDGDGYHQNSGAGCCVSTWR